MKSSQELTLKHLSSEEGQLCTVDVNTLRPMPVDYETYEWKPVTDGKYYRAVKAVIDFETSDKVLSVTNNGTLTETVLTPEKTSFVFEIADTAGNTVTQSVAYENYDDVKGKV